MQTDPNAIQDATSIASPDASAAESVAARLAALGCATIDRDAQAPDALVLTGGDGRSARLIPAGGANATTLLEAGRQMLAESEDNARLNRLAEAFSTKLVQAYEETHALFRIIRYAATGNDVAFNVHSACFQVFSTLPFAWIAIAFHDSTRVTETLRGSVVVAGNSGTPADIRSLAANMAAAYRVDTWSTIVEPGAHPLATATGAQVVCEPITHGGQVIGCVIAGEKGGPDPEVASPELLFLDAVADFLGTFHENAARFQEQQAMCLGTLAALSKSIDAKDPYTHGHSARVAELSRLIALAMGFSEAQAERVRISGLVHDVGKIGVPEAVLCKAGRLTDAEFAQIKLHPEIGHRILAEIPALQDSLPGVLHHHERFDGKGYPARLAGDDIPLFARIIGIADTFDAMSSSRSYRAAMPRQKVIDELNRCAGTQFDPAVVAAFMQINLAEYDAMLLGYNATAPAPATGPVAEPPRVAA